MCRTYGFPRWKDNVLYSLCSRLYEKQGKWEQRYAEMSDEEHNVFEHACCYVLLMHGAAPPYPNSNDEGYALPDDVQAYMRRNSWMTQVERTLMDMFALHPGHVRPFIAAFEKWYSTTMEEK